MLRVTDIGWISDTEGAVCKSHDEREQDNFEDFWVAPAKGTPRRRRRPAT